MLGLLGPETLPIVLIIALVLFGGSKIPELAKSLGKAKSEFQKGMSEGSKEAKDDETTAKPDEKTKADETAPTEKS